MWKTARELDLEGAEEKESQEICFVTDAEDGDYRRFLEERAPEAKRPGIWWTHQAMLLAGTTALPLYNWPEARARISSRKRLYVVDIDSQKNRVVLGDEGDLLKDGLIAEDINLIAIERLANTMEAGAKIRYRNPEAPAIISPVGEDRIKVRFKEPQRAIAKGQSVVFYDKDVVIGGWNYLLRAKEILDNIFLKR